MTISFLRYLLLYATAVLHLGATCVDSEEGSSVMKPYSMPKGTLALPLKRIVNQSAYGVEMRVGNPPQKMSVLVDTGSSMIGLQGANSNWCMLDYEPCMEYGSYNNSTSTTARYKDGDFYNALINHGYGSHISDTVRVGGDIFSRLTFGVIDDYEASYPAPSPNSGLMGMVPLCINSNCTNGPVTTLQQKLIKRGFLDSRHVLSVYLGPDTDNQLVNVGHMLYGAIDKAKQKGKVVTIPVINPVSSAANLSPNYVNFSSISLDRTQSNAGTKISTKNFKVGPGAYALLDTGYPGFALPNDALKSIKHYFDIKGNADRVDYKFRMQQNDNATLRVGFSNDQLQVRIPLSRLVTQLTPGRCVTRIESCGGTSGCPFGDTFLRSAYAVFDFEKLTIGLSNVEYTDKSEIVRA